MDEERRQKLMAWVAREVIVHEAPLRAWLRRTMTVDDVEDIIQESYCRIASLGDVSHIRSGRAYLFTTARMLVLERIRRSRVVKIDAAMEIEQLESAEDAPSPEQVVTSQQYLKRVKRLIDALPDRCREIFSLRKIEGLSQREVATRLGLPEHTVENDVAKGLRLILKAIADGEMEAEANLERLGTHATARNTTGN